MHDTHYLPLAEAMCQQFRDIFGYNEVEIREIEISRSGAVTFILSLMDDFQENIPSDMRYKADRWMRIDPDEPLQDWPIRAKREHAVLARRFAGVGEFASLLQSTAGRAFADELQAMANRFKLLEDRT